jgi:hypothetical protein
VTPLVAVGTLSVWLLEWAVTAGGLFVAYQAYRGFRRNGSRPMVFLAAGIGLMVGLHFVLEYPAEWLGLVTSLQAELLKQVVDLVALALIGYALVRP